MLAGHRRHLLRQAGPTAGEVDCGVVTPVIGAFSDAQLFEDPWTPPSGTASAWEPATLARASSDRDRPYRGEAIPYMLGGMTTVGDLALRPTWGMQDNPQWDPRGIGDFRTSQVYSGTGSRRYQGEALPMMVGALPGLAARRGRETARADANLPTYKACKGLKEWAVKNHIAVTADWNGRSTDRLVSAFGSVLVLNSTGDRIRAAEAAKQLAVLHRIFYNMSPLGGGRVLVYFSEDPAAFLVQRNGGPGEPPVVEYVGNVFGKLGSMFKRSPEQKKSKLAALEAKYKAIQAGEGQAGPFESPEGMLKKINRLRGELGLNPITESGEKAPTAEASEGFDDVGFIRRPLARRAVRRALLTPYRPLVGRPLLRRALLTPYRPLVGRPLLRRAVIGRPFLGRRAVIPLYRPGVLAVPQGVPMEGGSQEDD